MGIGSVAVSDSTGSFQSTPYDSSTAYDSSTIYDATQSGGAVTSTDGASNVAVTDAAQGGQAVVTDYI